MSHADDQSALHTPESPRDAARVQGPCLHSIFTTVDGTQPDYQILRYDDQGLDEVLVNHCSIHIERLTGKEIWIGITRPDGKMLHVTISARKHVTAEVGEDELGCVSSTMGQPGYGHEEGET